MQVRLMIEGQEGVSWDEWVALARAAEAIGLDGLFRSDHYTSFHGAPGAALDAWATILALAPLTERLRLGTLVSAATFRHPSELARVALTADHVSGGRVEVGVGAGWFEGEHRQNGFPFPPVAERFDRFVEYVEILVRSWSSEPFDFHGAHFNLERQRVLPAPLQSPHPPLLIGGTGRPRSLRLAAAHAQEYNCAFLDVEGCVALRARLDQACVAIDRQPSSLRLSVMTLVSLGRNGDEARRRHERGLELFQGPADRCHVGTLDEMTQLLADYERAGVTRMYLQLPDRRDDEALSLMGELARRAK